MMFALLASGALSAASAAAIIDDPPPATFKPPPLGFSSWNKFGMGITAPVLLEVADAFASSGLQAAGYLYLCTDDGWMDPGLRNSGVENEF